MTSPLGEPVPGWTPRPLPERKVLTGRTVRLEPLEPGMHEEDLWEAAQGANDIPGFWDYLGYGPYFQRSVFHDDIATHAASSDPLFFAAIDQATGRAVGVASLLRIDAANGVAEVGHIWFGPALRQSTAATEAIFLFADYVCSDLGYRRFEWKCNALNAPSRRAAERFGFTYEGTFRNHLISKGRNRDTAWYAFIDSEWPTIRAAFVAWLDPDNFDAAGRQIRRLEEIRIARSTEPDDERFPTAAG
jgi:RimJ/RimL family protein N-acetyltransferase